MKPDYKNWMPEGLVISAIAAFAICMICSVRSSLYMVHGTWQPEVNRIDHTAIAFHCICISFLEGCHDVPCFFLQWQTEAVERSD